MAPVPAIFDEDTSRLILSAQRHQKDLVEFQIPRLRSCTGPLSLQQSLAAELREDIDSFARQVEALSILVGDQWGEHNRQELSHTVNKFKEALNGLRQDSRSALLASKRAIDSQRRSQRDELLASVITEKSGATEKVTDDALMKANDDVTDALRRTINLMQGELERSVLSSQMLDASTASLRSTSSTHDTLSHVMSTSKQLVTALEKSDWLDRVLILSAFMFFFLVILFILKQRILDRGMRVAFWWTRFLPDFSGDAELLQMGKGDVISGTSSVASMIASPVSVAAASLISTTATLLSTHDSGVLEAGSTISASSSFIESTPSADTTADTSGQIPGAVHVEL